MIIPLSKRLFVSVVFAGLFLLIPATAQIVSENTNQFMLEQQSASVFFLYQSVEPQKKTFEIGEDIRMVSTLSVFKDIDFVWDDILRCDFGSGYEYYSNSLSSGENPKKVENKVSTWVYQAEVPAEPADCYMESNIKAGVGFSVFKDQKIISGNFSIK